MITIDDVKENKNNYFLGTIIIVFFSLIIITIVIVYYWIATDSVPKYISIYFLPEEIKIDNNILPELQKKEPIVIEKETNPNATKVIKYSFPEIMPSEIKDGSCQEYSKAQPYRDDAFKCTIEETVYDPCFSNGKKDLPAQAGQVVCQMNPLSQDIFIINLKDPLLEEKLPVVLRTNWAWFLELEDGTICAPYTGSRPLINNTEAFYGCKAKVKGDLDVLMGDLIIGEIWTAKRMIVTKDEAGTGWDTKFSETVKIKTIWQ
ncbi:MAG: hypothetical protein A2312_00175 [Candidatus Staskawiczbacteria bacterium RIFOXYB2_FULL_32_9]|uniref:Uncharacterized protein n=1 Tax=Candidatus Staskawiczbacteria bacterium RIFOXYD1_FULL_32_13 TaxID=1802234 RepID=A0A1G2JNW6_9BACT|nr:MAG: hypothetical protein UR22_C0006G0050 [Parcubacteria group bacterium GW2011_GWC2_32_10]OGJ50289.1 MAG: hypothetical protein A2229_03620 [Candidatus Peregrinibacteria bacterium RIFOXYA2_FULL_33_7]OGZ78446.1 MAG: hypothetical protein A2360_04050 [Candidatus Staskawiczbacteria bacterium RIFOXYB1_FULL_32_11]OGZ84843.1 MAG: hypothetical protein A2312_00175 [Candidatus Staskawiczbacteria bacterium RIFOXYB2_FULL_32_9]OGZ87318.1 MAG: hypothetical protein A2463_03665 [Candidatus Staskawiczbacteri